MRCSIDVLAKESIVGDLEAIFPQNLFKSKMHDDMLQQVQKVRRCYKITRLMSTVFACRAVLLHRYRLRPEDDKGGAGGDGWCQRGFKLFNKMPKCRVH